MDKGHLKQPGPQGRHALVPQISLVVIDLISFQKAEKLVFEAVLLMVLFLIDDIVHHLLLFRFAHTESTVACCQQNPLRFENVSCTQRDEFDFTTLTNSAIVIVLGNDAYR